MSQVKKRQEAGPVERLVRHDRLIVASAVALIVFGAAVYTVMGVGMNMSALEMTRMARPIGQPMQMGDGVDWTLSYALLVFLMWWIMMVAMMTPSAAPMLLLYTALKRQGPEGDRARSYSLLFLGGYLAAWAAFSVLAVSLQWCLEQAGLAASAMMTISSRAFAGAVLLAAGVYQFTALKNACLSHCRSPAHFLAEHNQPGAMGAFRIGAHHGTYCLGCCWALMALLFVGGVMNLYWVVGLALFVLAEKLAPNGRIFSRAAGVGLCLAGGYSLTTAIF
jgi:predicted metal-binding membrane protein